MHRLDSIADVDADELTESIAALTDHSVVTGDDFWHTSESTRSVVLVDYRVEDANTLLVGMGLTDADIYFIGEGVDGVTWMRDILSQYSDQSIDSLQILSHGGIGTILLGTTELSAETIQQYSTSLQSWQSYLTSDADILIFGCDVAAGQNGELLVNQLSVLTGADVAASTDKTGNSSLGGNWELEYQTGMVQWNSAFASQLTNYQYLLAEGTATANFLIGSSVTETHNGYAGNDVLLGGSNVAADGQFLNGSVTNPFSTYSSGQTFGSWTVTNGSVDLLGSYGYTSPTGAVVWTSMVMPQVRSAKRFQRLWATRTWFDS